MEDRAAGERLPVRLAQGFEYQVERLMTSQIGDCHRLRWFTRFESCSALSRRSL